MSTNPKPEAPTGSLIPGCGLTIPVLSLKCYVCGKDILGRFCLASEAERTDRPFCVHESCARRLDSGVRLTYVGTPGDAA